MVSKTGKVAQMMPVNATAWTQRVGNGHWDSVECEGRTGEYLTGPQIEAIAKIFAWGHSVRGWPLQVATAPAGRGLGHHSMGAENGIDWGHSMCPGEPIKSQKPAIVARATEIVNGDGGSIGEFLILTDGPVPNGIYYSNYVACRWIPTPDLVKALVDRGAAKPYTGLGQFTVEAATPIFGPPLDTLRGAKGDKGDPGTVTAHKHSFSGATGAAVAT